MAMLLAAVALVAVILVTVLWAVALPLMATYCMSV